MRSASRNKTDFLRNVSHKNHTPHTRIEHLSDKLSVMAEPQTRRSILMALCAYAYRPQTSFAATGSAAAPGSTAAEHFRGETLFSCHYRVHASIAMFGVTVLTAKDVGAGYAAVESGWAEEATSEELLFAAGANPDRAAGLNRFGVLRETIRDRAGAGQAVGFVGLISACREKNVEEARRAFHARADAADVTIMHGRVSNGRAWSHTETIRTRIPTSWIHAVRLLGTLVEGCMTASGPGTESREALPFLATMRKAGLCTAPRFRAQFLHGDQRFGSRVAPKPPIAWPVDWPYL
jgi:hypothetical protein